MRWNSTTLDCSILVASQVWVPITGTSFTGDRTSDKPYPVRGKRFQEAVIKDLQTRFDMVRALILAFRVDIRLPAFLLLDYKDHCLASYEDFVGGCAGHRCRGDSNRRLVWRACSLSDV